MDGEENKNGELVLRKKIPFHYKLSGNFPAKNNKFRTHRPSFGRQMTFEFLIFVEMVLMLYVITKVDNPASLINDEVVLYKNNIVLGSLSLYAISQLLKLIYYTTHPWPLQLPNWKKISDLLLCVVLILVPVLFVVPVLSVFLGPSPDSPELAVYSWYDNDTTEWLHNNHSTAMIGYSSLVFLVVFLFLLITGLCIAKCTSYDGGNNWLTAWVIWYLLGSLTLFIMACYGLNQARLMNSAYNEELLFEEMTETYTEYGNLPGNKTDHTWVLTQHNLNCSDVEDCFHKLDQGIKEFISSAHSLYFPTHHAHHFCFVGCLQYYS